MSQSEDALYLAVDIGGTKVAFLLANASGQEVARHQISTPDAAGIVSAISEYAAQAPTGLSAIGIGTTGVVNPHTGTITSASNTIAGWHGFALKQEVEAATGLATAVENDVNAFVLGEFAATGQLEGSLVGLMLGTGVGGAIILNGQLLRGATGGAGELGHMPGFGNEPCTCGRAGHLETIASGRGIARHYAQRAGLEAPTAKPPAEEVAQLAREGNSVAQSVFYEAGYQVGVALTIAATVLDVPTVLLGGSVMKSWDLMAPGFHAASVDNPPLSGQPLEIVRAQLGDDAVLRGALHRATQI